MLGFFKKRQHSGLRDLLSAYIDGQTTELESSRVEAHLAVCGECRAELESLRGTVSLLRSFPEYELPRSFVLTQAPAPVRTAAPKVVWTARLATSFAGIVLLALVLGDALGVVSQSTGTEQQEMSATADAPGLPGAPAQQPGLQGGIEAQEFARSSAAQSAPEPPAMPAPSQPQAPAQPMAPMPMQPATAAASPTPESEAPTSELFAPSPSAGATADASAGASEPQMAEVQVPDEAEKNALSSASIAQPTPAPDAGFGVTGGAPPSESFQAESPQPGQEATPADGPVITLMRDDGGAEEHVQLAKDANTGLALPLWQLEVAAGAALLILAAATFWTTRRSWRA